MVPSARRLLLIGVMLAVATLTNITGALLVGRELGFTSGAE